MPSTEVLGIFFRASGMTHCRRVLVVLARTLVRLRHFRRGSHMMVWEICLPAEHSCALSQPLFPLSLSSLLPVAIVELLGCAQVPGSVRLELPPAPPAALVWLVWSAVAMWLGWAAAAPPAMWLKWSVAPCGSVSLKGCHAPNRCSKVSSTSSSWCPAVQRGSNMWNTGDESYGGFPGGQGVHGAAIG